MKTKTITHDIYLAASLLTFGCSIESVDRSDPKHIKFTLSMDGPNFESPNLPDAHVVGDGGIEKYKNMWLNGTLTVNAVAFKHAFQHMQSIIHSS